MSLDIVMSDKTALWKSMVEKYNLESLSYESVSSWRFGDFVFGWDYDMFADGSKARRFGFHEYVETEAMFLNILGDLRRRKVIP